MNEADPRVKRTRKLLRDAFSELLAEKSFHAISVQDIAERATVNRATFYAHFEDKHALLDQFVGESFREELLRALPPSAPFSVGNLRQLIVTVLDSLAWFHDHCKMAHRDIAQLIEARVQRELHDYLLGWFGTLPPRDGGRAVGLERAAALASWTIFGAGVEWGRDGERTSSESMAGDVLDLVLGGLWRVADLAEGAQRERPRPATLVGT